MSDSKNILLVDDEDYVIEGIKRNIRWEEIPITGIFSANNIRQAKKVLSTMHIEIIICDIVMPQGTGFDLMEWVRAKGLPVQVIFLTSYADFDYAKRAINLDSVDYLLKPIDYQKLEETIVHAMKKVEELLKYEEYKQKSSLWEDTKKRMQRSFLEEVAAGRISDLEQLRQNKYYEDGDEFCPLLLHLYEKDDQNELEPDFLAFIIGNVMGEMLEDSVYSMEHVIVKDERRFLVLLKENTRAEEFTRDKIEAELEQSVAEFCSWAEQKLHADIWCGIGKVAQITSLKGAVEEIIEMRKNNLAVWNRVVTINSFEEKKIKYANPSVKIWRDLLKEKNIVELCHSIEGYLNQMEKKEQITFDILKNLRTDVIQMLYTWLAEQEVKARFLFDDEKSEHIYETATESVRDAKEFVRYYVSRALKYDEFAHNPQSVVDVIIEYIDNHYQEEINRNELAQIVYLNIDYISRLFKKEKGISISVYMMQKRIEAAKEMLEETSIPINAVALYVGYSNFSYFSKMFRENVGMSPIEYRKKYMGKEMERK